VGPIFRTTACTCFLSTSINRSINQAWCFEHLEYDIMAPSQRFQTSPCSHYQRNCSLWAPCCHRTVCCHRGHDDSRTCSIRLTTNRATISHVVCNSCKRLQSITSSSRKCAYCSQIFGRYYCQICKIWDKGPAFHCSKCRMCIKNPPRETRHCSVCNMCYPLSSSVSCFISRIQKSNTCPYPGCRKPLRSTASSSHRS